MSDRIIVHVDMDAFFASIEQLDNIEYRNQPVVVGADPQDGRGRGVVSASSYEARRYGIHSAMPISRAYRLCPTAIFVRPRMRRYAEVSQQVMKVLYEFSPLVEQISIDEAFLDCTGTQTLIGPPSILGRRIKERIRQVTLLIASVGIATNKSIAKIASDLGKPDGLVICEPGDEKKLLEDLPLRYLWGAGKKTVEKLESFGYRKIGDVASCSSEKLVQEFGKIGLHLWNLANGIDERPVTSEGTRKSISEEITFPRDVESDNYIEHVLFQISDRLSRRMRNLDLKGKTITLKIRLEGFETFTRSKTFPYSVNDTDTIREVSTDLYRNFNRKGKKIRLVGIGVSNLNTEASAQREQLELFQRVKEESTPQKMTTTDALLDEMKRLYGHKVTRAAFLEGFINEEEDT